MATKVKLICENCKKEFEVNKGKEKKTCSKECRWELRRKKDDKYYITKQCEFCGNDFTSKIKENKKFCSYDCSGKAKHEKAIEERTCLLCNKKFTERKKYKRKFCSDKCRLEWQNMPENKAKRIEKSKKSLKNKYGVDSIFKVKEFRDKINEKRKKLSIDEWNIINSKIKETKKEKYDDENYNNYAQIKETKKKLYDDPYFNNRVKFKKTINNKLIKRLDKLGYSLIEFINNDYLKIKHPDGHIFTTQRGLLLVRLVENRELSTKYLPYFPNISNYELKIASFLNDLGINFQTNIKSIISPYELDFYLPEFNLAIEFNGLYWHSEYYKTPNYHLNKLMLCNKKNIHLIQIFEDEWVHKEDIVKSVILNKLGKQQNKIYARKTNIVELNNIDYKRFLINNHLLGATKSSVKLGLIFENKLVAVMGFKRDKKSYNMNRFCNKKNTVIIGGASKLLKYFNSNYDFESIITFADRRYSEGDLYFKLNFKLVSTSKPNYWYCDYRNILRYHRFNFRKNKLGILNSNITEHEAMLKQKIPRIYDCGLLKFKK